MADIRRHSGSIRHGRRITLKYRLSGMSGWRNEDGNQAAKGAAVPEGRRR